MNPCALCGATGHTTADHYAPAALEARIIALEYRVKELEALLSRAMADIRQLDDRTIGTVRIG